MLLLKPEWLNRSFVFQSSRGKSDPFAFPADHRSEDAGDEVFGFLSSSENLERRSISRATHVP